MRKQAMLGLLAAAAITAGCQQGGAARPTEAVISAAANVRAADIDILPIVKPHYAPPKPLPRLPDGSRWLLPDHRVVAFYGAAGAPALGVLGAGSPDDLWPRLARQARAYRTRHVDVLPAYELIAFIATGSRGNQGNYSSRIADRIIGRYAHAAKRHHGLLILDIQPGQGRFLPDARSLKKWLELPYVGLALDPEWKLYPGQTPLSRIGHTGAAAINHVSRWLNHLTRTGRLPQKLLLVHEFTDSMVQNKPALQRRKHLALVFNADGFGSRGAKIGKYRDFARDHRFPLGFKLFYDWDIDMLAPRDVLRLRPRPAVVEYE